MAREWTSVADSSTDDRVDSIEIGNAQQLQDVKECQDERKRASSKRNFHGRPAHYVWGTFWCLRGPARMAEGLRAACDTETV